MFAANDTVRRSSRFPRPASAFALSTLLTLTTLPTGSLLVLPTAAMNFTG